MFEINECICILQSGEQAILAFALYSLNNFQHLTSSQQALDTSGMVIQMGAQEFDILVQE